ncbi:hypothetical protein PG990_015291 [Apiospora arundinis]
MDTHHHANRVSIEQQQSSDGLGGHVYSKQTSSQNLTASTLGNPNMPTASDIFLQESHEGGIMPINIDNGNSRVRQPTPTLSVDIPVGVVQGEETVMTSAMTWGPDFANFPFDSSLDLLNDDLNNNAAAAPPTPTMHGFNKAMIVARSHTAAAAYGRATALQNSRNIIRGQEKYGSFSSSADDIPPSSAVSSSSSSGCSTGETDSVSPGSGGVRKQEILLPSSSSPSSSSPGQLRCPKCNFVPTGKQEKRLAYFQKHQAIHSGQRFPCPKCGKTYSRKDNAASHVKRVHSKGSSAAPGTPSPSPAAAAGSNARKRHGSGSGYNGDHMNSAQQRKKSRSHSNESQAAAAAAAMLAPGNGGGWL